MADRLDELMKYWQKHNVIPADHVADRHEISAYEQRYKVVLPNDLRAYVSRVNGIRGGAELEFDHEGMSFLPLSSMYPESEWSEHEDPSNRFVFADMLIKSYWWCALLDDTPREITPIYLGGGFPGKNRLVATSLDEFFQKYMHDHASIHF